MWKLATSDSTHDPNMANKDNMLEMSSEPYFKVNLTYDYFVRLVQTHMEAKVQ